jgi:hypothetical protein
MIAHYFSVKNRKKFKLLLVALIFLAPFRLTIADEREFRVVDENGTPVRGAIARQTWYQYSLGYRSEENYKADADGYILLPKRAIYTNLTFLLLGAIGEIIVYKIHASIESSDSIGVHADGYEWRWFHDGKGLEKKLVVLKRQ